MAHARSWPRSRHRKRNRRRPYAQDGTLSAHLSSGQTPVRDGQLVKYLAIEPAPHAEEELLVDKIATDQPPALFRRAGDHLGVTSPARASRTVLVDLSRSSCCRRSTLRTFGCSQISEAVRRRHSSPRETSESVEIGGPSDAGGKWQLGLIQYAIQNFRVERAASRCPVKRGEAGGSSRFGMRCNLQSRPKS